MNYITNFAQRPMHNFRNFAQQPMQGGMMNVLTAFDLYRDEINKTEVFDKADLFLPEERKPTFNSMQGDVTVFDEKFSNFRGQRNIFY
jgi:hypothetical protein